MTRQALQQRAPNSYVSGISDTPLKGETIGDCFDATVARFPDGEALLSLHQGLRYTWKELQQAVNQAARAMLALGVKKGDRVGIWSPNCAEWTITQFATAFGLRCRAMPRRRYASRQRGSYCRYTVKSLAASSQRSRA